MGTGSHWHPISFFHLTRTVKKESKKGGDKDETVDVVETTVCRRNGPDTEGWAYSLVQGMYRAGKMPAPQDLVLQDSVAGVRW
jgi:hypothetical protein